jgi:hypothetical protein
MHQVDEPEPERRRHFFADVLVPGSLAGMAGGFLTGILALASAAVLGKDPWLVFKLLAGTIFRDASLAQLHGGAAFWGVALLLAVSGGLGVAFALLLPRGGSAMVSLFLGAGFGLVSYLVFVQLLLWADPLLEHALPQEALFPYVVLLGCCLGLVAPLRRWSRPVGMLLH